MSPIKKKGLGRGLSALFGDDKPKDQVKAVNQTNLISISDLSRNPYQPRQNFKEEKLEELANSIRKNGVIQPIAVRPNKSDKSKFEIVAGERRWRAAQLAGISTVPAIIRDLNNDETAKIALIENLQREDLNALDQAKGLFRLQREFNLTQEELGAAVGKSRSTVTNLLRLLSLCSEVQSLLEEGKIEMGHARSLLTLSEEVQLQCAQRVISESLSVRECETMVSGLSGVEKKDTKSQTQRDPNTVSLEKELSEILGSPVEIKHNKKGAGKLIVSYKNLDALEGVLNKLKS